MCNHKFELGDVLKDTVTKIEGAVMVRAEYYSGCTHYGLCPLKSTSDGKEPDWVWLDEIRLVKTKKKRITPESRSGNNDAGGPAPCGPQV